GPQGRVTSSVRVSGIGRYCRAIRAAAPAPGKISLTGFGEGLITVARLSTQSETIMEVLRMLVTRRELLKGAAAFGAAAALPGQAWAQTTQKKELVTAQGGDIAKFDPHFSTSSNDIRVSFNLFDNLTSRHPDGKLYPGLATEWKLQGQTTWRFKLRQGVKYHNGDPFTSADAKYSIE